MSLFPFRREKEKTIKILIIDVKDPFITFDRYDDRSLMEKDKILNFKTYEEAAAWYYRTHIALNTKKLLEKSL